MVNVFIVEAPSALMVMFPLDALSKYSAPPASRKMLLTKNLSPCILKPLPPESSEPKFPKSYVPSVVPFVTAKTVK